MKPDKCESCKKNYAAFSYEVDPEHPKRLCYECLGKYEPKELHERLGIKAALALLILIVPTLLLW